jgi:hypothetical protein
MKKKSRVPKSHYLTLVAGAGTLVLVSLVALASQVQADETYKFTIRGQVQAVDRANKTITISSTYTSDKAKDDLAGNAIEFNVNGAKFYKYDKNLKKVRTTLGNVPVQAEVVAKGSKRGTDRYNISELTVNPSSFSLIGKVKKQDSNNKILTVEVSSSDYKEATYKGKDVKVYYGDNTKFKNRQLQDINSDEIAANEEKAKIAGTVTNGWKFEALTVIDDYNKAK